MNFNLAQVANLFVTALVMGAAAIGIATAVFVLFFERNKAKAVTSSRDARW